MTRFLSKSSLALVMTGLFSPIFAQVIASNSATALSYSTVQAAINAATNSYTVFVYSNTVGAIQIYNKTNMTLTRASTAYGIPEIKDTSLGATTYGVDIQGCKGVTLSNIAVAEFYNGIGLGGNDYNIQIIGCAIRSNTSTGIGANGATVGSNLIASNTITAPNGNYAIYFDNGGYSNRILSNRISGPQNGIVLGSVGGCPGNTVAWNDISGLLYTAVSVNQSSFRTMITSNLINYGSANSVGISIGTSKAYSNYIVSNRILNQWQGIFAYSSNVIFNNEIAGYTSFGIALVGGATGTNNVIVSNLIRNGSGSAIEAYNLASGNFIASNRIVSNGGGDVISFSSVNGNIVMNNVIADNSGNGVHIGSTTGNVVLYNNFSGNSPWNITGTGSGGFFSNYFGDTNRAFSTKAANTAVGVYSQWLNGPIGSNGDFTVPAALVSVLATNGLPGQVSVHWGPTSAAPDFSCYKIFRSQTSNNYSNLTSSDLVQTITSAATTNFVDMPQAGGNTYYYVTVADTNGNESWYSPQSTVTYTSNDPPVASFTGPNLWITNQAASFTSTSWVGTDPITNYLWRFGDGTSVVGATSNSVSHIYTTVVTNFVSLTVWNNRGQSNTASNAIAVTGLNLVSGVMSGALTNGVTVTLSSPNTSLSTNTAGLGVYNFWVTNDTYTIQPIRLGYRFVPGSRSVTINYNDSTNNHFTASEIYPVLQFSNLSAGDKIKRDLSLLVTSDAPEILSTITYTVSNLSPTNHFNAIFNAAYGTAAAMDTTLREDGDYSVLAKAVDTVFGRTHVSQITVTFDNGLFKVLDKNLENLKAIAYDTIRHPSKNETLEFFFYIKDNQKVKIHLYSKLGRSVLSYGEQSYSHGHNRIALNLPVNLPTGPYYAVFECKEFTKSVLFVVSQ